MIFERLTTVHVKQDEFEIAGQTKEPSKLVKPWSVGEGPIQFEYKLYGFSFISIRVSSDVDVIIGSVMGVRIRS